MSYYINNKKLYNEMVRCLDASLAYSDELHEMFSKMVDGWGQKYTYKREEDRKDCAAQATIDCYLYWNRFNPKKGTNAFAYMTTVVRNGYQKGLRKLYPNGFESINKISISSGNIYTL